jgi:hypothetical protein
VLISPGESSFRRISVSSCFSIVAALADAGSRGPYHIPQRTDARQRYIDIRHAAAKVRPNDDALMETP